MYWGCGIVGVPSILILIFHSIFCETPNIFIAWITMDMFELWSPRVSKSAKLVLPDHSFLIFGWARSILHWYIVVVYLQKYIPECTIQEWPHICLIPYHYTIYTKVQYIKNGVNIGCQVAHIYHMISNRYCH